MNIDRMAENMTAEQFIKLFDYCTDGAFSPDQKTNEMSDDELLKELGL